MLAFRSMPAWEEWCLDEFFLKPGQSGPVEYIHVSDQDLMAFMGTDDIDLASRAFTRALGAQSFVRDLLSDAGPLPRNLRPPSIRLLVYVCWAQVTSSRPARDLDLREILSNRLGWRVPSSLVGLNHLWDQLRRWLHDQHGVEFRIPLGKYAQIGSTVVLPFPTWRDLRHLRSIRDAMQVSLLSRPRSVAARIRTSGLAERSLAYVKFFEEWELSSKISDPAIFDLPFDRAWARVVAETTGSGDLCVVEDEYGEHRLELIDGGASRGLMRLEAPEVSRLKPWLARFVAHGEVPMEPIGFGRWLATDGEDASAVLVRCPRRRSASSI